MDKKKIKRVIAREGLILLEIAFILYCAGLFLFSKFIPPKSEYKVTLLDDSIRYIPIYPDAGSFNYSTKIEVMRKIYEPTQSLIMQRVKEFEEREKVTVVGSVEAVSSPGKSIMMVLLYFIMVGLLFQTIYIYLFVSLLRFIFWAIKTLKEK